MPDVEACVLRICDRQGHTRGTGFLVSERLAVTCAHVVKEGCGVEPGDRVCVVFCASGQEWEAEVLPECWRPFERDDAHPHLLLDDVAILRLLPQDEPLPRGVAPAQPGSTRACHGHAMRVLGFPPLKDGYDVAWAEGELRGVVPHPDKRPMLQMDARPIYEGMSGAPVLDLATQRVVGMVCEYLPDAPLEWATPTGTLQAICPDLRLHPPQAVEDYLAALHEYCANLPYVSLHDIRPPRTLDEVYVPLKARPQADEDLAGLGDLPGLDRGEPLSIAEVMGRREPPYVLILGEPGAGKSTLLRQLAGRAWDAPHLPILVPLRRLHWCVMRRWASGFARVLPQRWGSLPMFAPCPLSSRLARRTRANMCVAPGRGPSSGFAGRQDEVDSQPPLGPILTLLVNGLCSLPDNQFGSSTTITSVQG